MKKYFLIWFIVWVVIALLVAASGHAGILGGVALAAILSLFFMIGSLYSEWSGTVTEIKLERARGSGDDDCFYDVEFAYIKLKNGKIKKMRSMGYKVGDKLEKRRGQAMTQVKSLQNFCEQCGKPLKPDARFCESCGSAINTAS